MKYLVALLLFQAQLSMAESMDLETHDMVIDKLEMAMVGNTNADTKLRLADLLADRARIKLIKQEEQNCKNCLKAQQDKKKALKLYHQIFDSINREQQERVFLQISQIHLYLNETSKAVKFHRKVIASKKYHKQLKALAHLSEGEQYFFNQKFSKAYKEFKTALRLSQKVDTALTRYRMAWCEFNAGKFKIAKMHLAEILQSNQSMDDQLRNDIAKDYARFSAKGPIKQRDLVSVHQLSAQSEAMSNLELLASELDRLGRPYENLDANNYIIENFEMTPIDKAAAYLRISQAEQTLKRNNKTIEYLAKSTESFAKTNCEKIQFQCTEYSKNIEKFLVYWNRVEKDEPGATLLQAWVIYLKAFPKSYDMHYLAAQSFHKSKKMAQAVENYLKTAQILKSEQKIKEQKKLFISSLDSAMTVAEESKAIFLRHLAYSQYLVIYPEGPKKIQSHYQLAYLKYEEKKYEEALAGFKSVISMSFAEKPNKKGNLAIAKKSADLNLDIYALSKANVPIMEHAQQYAQQFPANRSEYLAVYRKALLHEANASLDKDSVAEQKKWLALMVKVPFNGVEEKEQILMLETQVRLARKTQNLTEMIRSGRKLLSYKKLPSKTREFAYTQLVWAFQVSFNFKQAFSYEKGRLEGKKPTRADNLRLATLAELAGKNPHRYYENYLDKTGGTLAKNRIRAKIVQTSYIPWKHLKDQLAQLVKSPLLLSELALETYAKFKNVNGAESIFEYKGIAKKPSGKILKRHLEIPKFRRYANKLKSHKLSRHSAYTEKTVARRMELMGDVERMANEAIDRNDFSLQIAGLTVLSSEKARFAAELKALPVPRGLNANQRKQYQILMDQKVKTIQSEAINIQKTLKAKWSGQKYIAQLRKAQNEGTVYYADLVSEEGKFLLLYAPENEQSEIRKLMSPKNPSKKDLADARLKVRENPFNVKALQNLRPLEEKFGNTTEVAFLDQRLLELKKEVKP